MVVADALNTLQISSSCVAPSAGVSVIVVSSVRDSQLIVHLSGDNEMKELVRCVPLGEKEQAMGGGRHNANFPVEVIQRVRQVENFVS